MRRSGFAAAVILVMLGLSFASLQSAQAQANVDGRIAHFRSSLRLTVEQERLWPVVDSAIRHAVAEYEAEGRRANGFLQWAGAKASAASGDAAYIRQAIAVSQPLLRSLDPTQRRDGMKAAKQLGFGALANAF